MSSIDAVLDAFRAVNCTGESIAADIRAEGGNATFATCDVSDRESMDAMLDQIVDQHGRIDCGEPTRKGHIGATIIVNRDVDSANPFRG